MTFFYFVNRRFPSTTAHTLIPRGDLPMEDLKLKTEYVFDDDPPPPSPFETIEDNLNTEPENID